MAEHRPIVMIGGVLKELPDGDTIAGVPPAIYASRRSAATAQVLTSSWATISIDERFDSAAAYLFVSDAAEFTWSGSDDEVTVTTGGHWLLESMLHYEQTGGNNRTDVEVRIQKKIGGGSWGTLGGDTGSGYSRNTANGNESVAVWADDTLSAGDDIRIQARTASGSGVIQIKASGANIRLIRLGA